MGNSCCRGEGISSSVVFAHTGVTEKESLLGDKTSSTIYENQQHEHREVKIKITKEKLEELLGEADVHGMSVDQIITTLISASADHHYYDYDHHDHHLHCIDHHRPWRPALQTIPEVN